MTYAYSMLKSLKENENMSRKQFRYCFFFSVFLSFSITLQSPDLGNLPHSFSHHLPANFSVLHAFVGLY